MGVHNVQSVGCPSFYKYFDGFYPEVAAPSIRGGADDFYSWNY